MSSKDSAARKEVAAKETAARKASATASTAGASNAEVIDKAVRTYWAQTPGKLKAIDAFLVYVMLTGIIQFVYCVVVGPYPFNSFLAGFLSCIGTFVLTVALRMQATGGNKDFQESPPKRAFADFIVCNAILHLWVMNFMG